jgi:Secretion system C-terminal sorting domain
MKKIFLMLIAWSAYLSTNAQIIVAAEFFVDTDPGVGNGTPIPVSPTGATVNFTASVPTGALSNGFHFVGIRTKDDLGKWGLYENRGFYISSSTTNVGNIVAAEFFVDADPGLGNGTAITPITAGPNPTFLATIPTTLLTNGFHFVAIRTKDIDGKWGLFENRGFYISSSTTNVGNITAAEFFVDADPGVGNGTSITVPTGVNVNFVATVPTTSLATGFHFVAIRTKDVNGKWGLFENRGFYISSSTTNVGNIVAAEFFIDADPGVGNGTSITVPTGANVNFVATVPTTSLATGFHFVAVRTKDVNGKWGLFENRGFYISTQTNNSAGMTAAEYFIDTDPGVGNGTPFTIPGGQSFNQNFVLPIPIGTSQGQHFIAIRTKNNWGLFDFDTVTVSGVVTPLKLLSFDAYKNQNTVLLKWKTTNEVNTAYFDVERSSNGTTFDKIGKVNALNIAGNNNYLLQDDQPNKGINFYRLRQVDLDGRFTYSTIIKVLFDEYGKVANIYPNPANDFVKIDFTGKQKTVLINVYDAEGRQVLLTSMPNQQPLKLNINHLPKGKYILQLSDGQTNNTASFIKQ